MKTTFKKLTLFVLVSLSLVSCSKESQSDSPEVATAEQLNATYNYTAEENELMTIINNYRTSKGLNSLTKVDFISTKSEEHDNYMISLGTVSHNYFQDRYQALVTNLGATNVSENLAYNYATPQAVFNAWMMSSGHKANIEGDFTHFGLSIRVAADGKKYYTNLFMKK